MSDWRSGDLALCVRGGCIDGLPLTGEAWPEAGRIYTVSGSRMEAFSMGAALGLILLDGPKNGRGESIWDACRFIKVTPPEADEYDREIIKLMNGKPEPVEWR